MKLGPTELMMVLAVVVILFGPTQIPKLTKMFGQGIKSFREGMGSDKDDQAAQQPAALDAQNHTEDAK